MTDALKEVLAKSKVTVLSEDYSLLEVAKEDFEFAEGIEKAEFFALISFAGKNTFVCPTRFVADLDASDTERVDGWKVIMLGTELPIELVGYTAEISKALSQAEINLLCVASFGTDHYLVKMEELDKAVNALNILIENAKRL